MIVLGEARQGQIGRHITASAASGQAPCTSPVAQYRSLRDRTICEVVFHGAGDLNMHSLR